ncbi:antibiotic biosynthesis monooxygenase family protein [Amycolatopsis sp.]|jgi:quinol monooxygenase YgiN|uniref:putative quinol monooxygenase n=1 Tax=Amycolatopsis sp. TaxID=37632 RepID=UPI002E02663F|nr:antibiotic biosynthesis monooxygenase family protein [Amycolatopsis sp.]
MLIVSGKIYVDPAAREKYLADCVQVVEQARATAGCFDFSLSADIVEPGRINIYERWDTDEQLQSFRGSGPSDEQTAEILDADVAKYRISTVEAP